MKVFFAPAPVNNQVFGEKASDDHPAAVVHPANGIELTHGSIDNRVAGSAFAPGLKMVFVIVPGKVFKRLAVRAFGEFWEKVHDALVKFAPGEFLLPGTNIFVGFVAAGTAVSVIGSLPDGANAEGAKFERSAERGGAGDSWEVALFVVFGDRSSILTKLL